jgi:hypothetical protein
MTSRSIIGLALAAVLAAPAAAHAQARRSNPGGAGIWLGGMFGLESGSESGFQLRFDGEVPIARAAPNLQFAGVGSISFASLSSDLKVFEFVPAARLNWTATPTLGAYGDIGLGLFHATVPHASDTGAVMRILGGVYYEMNPTTRFSGEIGLHPHFGDYDDTTFTLMLGAKFRI